MKATRLSGKVGRRLLGLVAVVSAMTLSTITPAQAVLDSATEQQILSSINAQRIAGGCQPLTIDGRLRSAAQATADTGGSTSPMPLDLARAAGYSNPRGFWAVTVLASEPISALTQTARPAFMECALTKVGIASGRAWWAEIFGLPIVVDAATEQSVLTGVNTQRTAAGCGPVSLDSRLRTSAQAHATDMASRAFFSSTNPDGRTPQDRMRTAGHPNPGAEIITNSATTADAVVTSWMNTPAQRAQILNCANVTIGVGRDTTATSALWTLGFGLSTTIDAVTEQGMLTALNARRATAGCAPLTVDSRLRNAAQAHTTDMVTRGFVSSVTPEGRTAANRMQTAGYTNPGAENIANGPTTAAAVVTSWMNNATNRANIVNCAHTTFGAGFDARGFLWTADFGLRTTLDTTTEQALLTALNAQRTTAGCQPLTIDSRLRTSAQAHATDMRTRNFLALVNPDGVNQLQRMLNAGYPNPAQEIIASGITSTSTLVNAWMSSEPQRSHIVNCTHTAVGIGLALDGWFWTVDFGR